MDNNIYRVSKQIASKQDFDDFLKLLYSDYVQNNQQWENNTLERFLSALERYSVDTEDITNPTWEDFARLLYAATIYE